MLRESLVALGVVGLLAGVPAVAQEATLESVLDGYYETIGGLEAWEAAETLRFRGSMTVGPGMEAPVTLSAKRPDKARLEFTLQGMTGVQAYDGETAWMIMPFLGKDEPEVMPEEQAREMKEQADIDGPLVGWKEKGHRIQLLGTEDVEGTETYKLQVDLASGDTDYYYLDTEYHLPIRREGKRTIQEQEVEFEVTMGDYKEVDGLLLAHYFENRRKGAEGAQVITIESVEINPELEEGIFTMPEPAPEAEAEDESGESPGS